MADLCAFKGAVYWKTNHKSFCSVWLLSQSRHLRHHKGGEKKNIKKANTPEIATLDLQKWWPTAAVLAIRRLLLPAGSVPFRAASHCAAWPIFVLLLGRTKRDLD